MVQFQDYVQPWLVIFREANMFTCLLSFFKSHSFSFGNQLQTNMRNIEESLQENYDLTEITILFRNHDCSIH